MDSALNSSNAAKERPTTLIELLSAVLCALIVLTKPKIALASVVSVLVVFLSIAKAPTFAHLLVLLLGSGMAAGGSLAFNQWWERDSDPLMRRTKSRPLPRKILSPIWALLWSVFLSLGGCILLCFGFGIVTALLGLATILVYDGLYTPLKRVTPWATEIGSISGALPPILGAAAGGHLSFAPAWILALALFFWQMPHFYAIGWIYRADYRAASLPLLPAIDPTGKQTALWSMIYSLLLIVTILGSWMAGMIGDVWAIMALFGCSFMLIRAGKFLIMTDHKDQAARRLFHASLLALPLLFLLVIH